jgi:riboflavin kinase/FMN adenylyltransferase
MIVIDGYRDFPKKEKGLALSIGNFDGIHEGHQALIRALKKQALIKRLPTAIYTFDPHPKSIVGKEKRNFLLTPRKPKIALLEKYQIDYLIIEKFDLSFSQIEKDAFLNDIILGALNAQLIIVGQNFRFGSKGAGDTRFLQTFVADKKVLFIEFPPLKTNEEIVSTSNIRSLIRLGKMESVKALLGRNYSIGGQVIRGQGLGATIGVPTANIDYANYLLPQKGVYEATAIFQGKKYRAVLNVGRRPTLPENILSLEVHLLDFSKSIYGQELQIEFLRYLRPEQKFDSLEALKQQIQKDIEWVRFHLVQEK